MSIFKTGDKASVLALILANLVPLGGVLFFGWTVSSIVRLYWLENLVIGGYTLLRIIILPVGNTKSSVEKYVATPIFCVHYGMFCAVHGVAILALFPNPSASDAGETLLGRLIWRLLSFLIPFLFLVVSHGISFVQNYLGEKEYVDLEIGDLMRAPYARILILHVVVVAAGFVIMMVGSPLPLLLLLIVLKIGMDVWLHNREHLRLQEE